jgi:hypothetical protein
MQRVRRWADYTLLPHPRTQRHSTTMIPSWRKRKALERKQRDYGGNNYREGKRLGISGTILLNPITLGNVPGIYCPNCGHRFDRTGHKFSCVG